MTISIFIYLSLSYPGGVDGADDAHDEDRHPHRQTRYRLHGKRRGVGTKTDVEEGPNEGCNDHERS